MKHLKFSKTMLFIIFCTISFKSQAQKHISKPILKTNAKSELNKIVVSDLLNACSYQCWYYHNNTLVTLAYMKLGLRYGSTYEDAAKSYQNAKLNKWMLDEVLNYFINSYDFMVANFKSINVNERSIKPLALYIKQNGFEIRKRIELRQKNEVEILSKEVKDEIKLTNEITKNEELNNTSIQNSCNNSFSYCEEMPYFKGGDEMFKKIIDTKFIELNSYNDGHFQGVIIAKLLIAEDGNIKVCEIEEEKNFNGKLTTNYKDEIINSIENINGWLCGKQNGHPVKVILPYNIEIKSEYEYTHSNDKIESIVSVDTLKKSGILVDEFEFDSLYKIHPVELSTETSNYSLKNGNKNKLIFVATDKAFMRINNKFEILKSIKFIKGENSNWNEEFENKDYIVKVIGKSIDDKNAVIEGATNDEGKIKVVNKTTKEEVELKFEGDSGE